MSMSRKPTKLEAGSEDEWKAQTIRKSTSSSFFCQEASSNSNQYLSPTISRRSSSISKASLSLKRFNSLINLSLRKSSSPSRSSSNSSSAAFADAFSMASSSHSSPSAQEVKERGRFIEHFPILKENSILYKATKARVLPATERPKCPLIGKLAPDFTLNDHLNRKCSLHATIALGRPIILFFFPLAGSPHCTAESCSFRDAIGASPIFNDLEAIVIGISQDPPSRSKRFVDEHHLGYQILHDDKREVMEAWGVRKVMLGLLDSRCTFVIDNNGIVRGMVEGVFDGVGHRTFAEKWLTRIEHELSGRIRRVEEVSISAGDLIIHNGKQATTKVTYGSESSAAGGGIGGVPRYGAFPSSQKLTEAQLATERQKKAGFKALIGNLSSAGVVDARDELEQLEIGGSSSSSTFPNRIANASGSTWSTRGRMASANETPSAKWSPASPQSSGSVQGGSLRTTNSDGNSLKGKRASWKSLATRPRSASNSIGGAGSFSRSRRHQEALEEPLPQSPAIPPTYQNIDTNEIEFRQVDSGSSYLQQVRSRNEGDSNKGLGIQPYNRSSLSRNGTIGKPPSSSGSNEVQFIARPSSANREVDDPRTPRSTSSANYDSSTWATRSSASTRSASTAETSVGSHGRNKSDALRREKERAEFEAASLPMPKPVPRSLPPPGRRSRGPQDVPRDAEDEDDNEEFVSLNAKGQIELTGRRNVRPNGSNGSDGSASVNTVMASKARSSSNRPTTAESSTSTSRGHSRSGSAGSFEATPLRPQDFARTYPKEEARDHLVLADGTKLGAPIPPKRKPSPSPSFTELEAKNVQVNVARRVEPASPVGKAKASVVRSPSITSRINGNTDSPSKASVESIRSSVLLDDDQGSLRVIPKKLTPPTYAPPPAPSDGERSANSSPLMTASALGTSVSSSRGWATEDPFSTSSSKNKFQTRSPQSQPRSNWDGRGMTSSNSGSSNGSLSNSHPTSVSLDNRRPSNQSIRSTGTFGPQGSPPEPFNRSNGNGSTFTKRNDSLHSDVSELSEDGTESVGSQRERYARANINGITTL